jgi:hypothetical protein
MVNAVTIKYRVSTPLRLSLNSLLRLGVSATTPDYLKRKINLSNALLWSRFGPAGCH